MRRKIVVLMAIVAVAMGVSFFAAPSISQAVVINNVSVSVNGAVFTLWGPGCGLGTCLPSVNLLPGQSLVLAQTNSFNFDTSDIVCAGGAAGATNCPNPTVSVTTTGPAQVFTDTTKVLTINNIDPISASFNEAQTYRSLGFSSGNDYQVLVAYADNVHTNACGSGVPAGLPANTTNCLPSPFNGGGGTTAATQFIGAGTALPPGFGTTNPNHCGNTGAPANTCWDSAVVQILATSAVPEPSALLLLGTGLVGFAAWRRRHLKKNA